jgi:hypothetical protein
MKVPDVKIKIKTTINNGPILLPKSKNTATDQKFVVRFLLS